MKNKVVAILTFALPIVLTSVATSGQTPAEPVTDPSVIFTKGQRAPATNFTGTVWVQQLIKPDSAFNIPVGYVTFEPGARSHWHSHAGGQVLLALGGALVTIRKRASSFRFCGKAMR